jgi:hypothetical protein
MNLNQWAIQWGVPFEAVEDLRRAFGVATDPGNLAQVAAGQSEAAAQAAVRLEASRLGGRLWRNNRGACYDDRGNFIRYGLGNDSDKLDKLIKSHDLIGIKPIRIGSEHVGLIIGQFWSRERKPPGWRYSGTDREVSQLKWAELVLSLGGDVCFATGEGTLK